MQETSGQPAGRAENEMWLTMIVRYVWCHRGIRLSIGTAILLLVWDAAITGSWLLSFLFCPIWFVLSILKNAIQRPGWRLALLRIGFPILALGVATANDALQLKIAEANGRRIVAACEEFHAAKGRFPKTLDELVPEYLPSVPRAKYCLAYGQFLYSNCGAPLVWYVVPPYYRKIYDFHTRHWTYLE